MKHVALIALLLLCGTAMAQSNASAPTCRQLSWSLARGETGIDYTQLRRLCLPPLAESIPEETTEQMFDAIDDEDYETAVKLAEAICERDPASLDAHAAAATALHQLGKTKREQFHRTVMHALMDSITQQRDGRSPETSWNAVLVHEVYSVLALKGYRVRSESMLESGGHRYNVLKVVPEDDSAPVDIYFNIDDAWANEHTNEKPPANDSPVKK